MEFEIATIPGGTWLTNDLIDRIRAEWNSNGHKKLSEDDVKDILANMQACGGKGYAPGAFISD